VICHITTFLAFLQLPLFGSCPDSAQSGFELVCCHELLHNRSRPNTSILFQVPAKVRKALLAVWQHAPSALLSKQLVTLDAGVQLPPDWAAAAFSQQGIRLCYLHPYQ
jgi:hypothetical protein